MRYTTLSFACILGWTAAFAHAAPMISLVNVPSTYTPGEDFTFQVSLSGVSNLNSFSIDLVLQAPQGTAGMDFYFNDALTTIPPNRYVFDPNQGVTPIGFFASADTLGATSMLNLSDFLPFDFFNGRGEKVDVTPGVNDLVANVVVSTTGNVGALSLQFDTAFLELDSTSGLIPDFAELAVSPPAVITPAQSAAIPEPSSVLLWCLTIFIGAASAHIALLPTSTVWRTW